MTSSEGAVSGLAWVPDACTLPTAQQPLRLAEFDDLFATAIRNTDRISQTHLRLILSGPQGLKAKVEDLATRENECCSFFDFNVAASDDGTVRFDIQVPAAHVDVLDALADRAINVGEDPQ